MHRTTLTAASPLAAATTLAAATAQAATAQVLVIATATLDISAAQESEKIILKKVDQ